MKTALISLYSFRNFGIQAVGSLLKDVDYIYFKRQIQDNMQEPTREEIEILINLLQKLKPKFVGISFRLCFLSVAVEITRAIRKHLDCVVVWGGTHMCFAPQDGLDFADVLCVGEGEEAMQELVEKYPHIDGIKNLWFKKNGTVISNEIRPLIDLDKLSYPRYENEYFIEGELFTNLPLSEGRYTTMASRGCPFACDFCSNINFLRLYKDKGKYLRFRSVEHFIGELLFARKRFDVKSYLFVDDIFTYDDGRVEEFAQKYSQINIPFRTSVHPLFTKEKTLRLLKNVGLWMVKMGVQSGSERVRFEIFNRRVKDEQILNAVKIINRLKIVNTYDLIANNTYEIEQDKRNTLSLFLKFPRPFHITYYRLNYFPFTPLTERTIRDGFIKREEVNDLARLSRYQTHFTKAFFYSRKEWTYYNLLRLAEIQYFPRWIIPLLVKCSPQFLQKVKRMAKMNSYMVKILPSFKRRQVQSHKGEG